MLFGSILRGKSSVSFFKIGTNDYDSVLAFWQTVVFDLCDQVAAMVAKINGGYAEFDIAFCIWL